MVEVTCLDLDPAALDCARASASAAGWMARRTSSATTRCAIRAAPTGADQPFDVIYAATCSTTSTSTWRLGSWGGSCYDCSRPAACSCMGEPASRPTPATGC